MLYYNVKIVDYADTGEQDIVFYSNPIRKMRKKEEKEKIILDDDISILDDDNECDGDLVKQDDEAITKDEVMKRLASIRSSRNRTVNCIYDYSRANIWEYFCTWTFDPKRVTSRYDYDELSMRMKYWLDNTKRRKAPNMQYIIVPEHHKDGAYHFHGLLSNLGNIKLVDSGKQVKGSTIYNMQDYRLGFSTVSQIKNTLKASNYITKYITSDLIINTKNKRRYWCSKNLKKGEVQKMFLDTLQINNLKEIYVNAKRQKKIVVEKGDYYNEIDYYTI